MKDLPKRGVFYGYHSKPVYEYSQEYLPKRGDWRINLGLSKNTLFVDNATEYHPFFRQAFEKICIEFPEILDYNIVFDGPEINVTKFLATDYPSSIDKIVFMHGTSSILVPKILEEGLRPRSESLVCPTYGTRFNAKEGDCNLIYLTTQRNTAGFASRDAAAVHGGTPAILYVGPGLKETFAEPDEDSGEITAIMSLWVLGNIAYRRPIPPYMIKR